MAVNAYLIIFFCCRFIFYFTLHKNKYRKYWVYLSSGRILTISEEGAGRWKYAGPWCWVEQGHLMNPQGRTSSHFWASCNYRQLGRVTVCMCTFVYAEKTFIAIQRYLISQYLNNQALISFNAMCFLQTKLSIEFCSWGISYCWPKINNDLSLCLPVHV